MLQSTVCRDGIYTVKAINFANFVRYSRMSLGQEDRLCVTREITEPQSFLTLLPHLLLVASFAARAVTVSRLLIACPLIITESF